MKLCPQCESGYSDRKSTCPIHGGLLTETGELPRGLLICGTYRILRKLGQGSMGTVYLVEHESAGELITLKFLNAELSGDESFTSRFERAAKRLSGLHHTNVLATGALERAEDDSLFFAMEYVDGPSLRELLNFAPAAFDPGLALAIARCVAEGLGAAHATGMVHLDLKPENILIAGDATLVPKIANFGIGATRENGNTFLAAGRILLTPTYAAPEQWLRHAIGAARWAHRPLRPGWDPVRNAHRPNGL
jgi:serine/threonine protein kinase